MIFATIVQRRKPTFNLGRTQLTLLYRLRHMDIEAHGTQVLLWACSQGYVTLVEKILDAQPDLINVLATGVDAWDGGRPLHIATQHRRTDVVKLLLKRGADPMHRNNSGKTCIWVACDRGFVKILDLFLTHPKTLERDGIDLNVTDKQNMTAMWITCSRGHDNIAKMLLEASKNAVARLDEMNEEEYEGDSDCESVDEELEEDIISRMTPDLELAHPEYGPPLCVSAGRGNTACLRVLLQAGADVNCVSEDGRTPIYLACERNNEEIANAILEERPPFSSYGKHGGSNSPLRDRYFDQDEDDEDDDMLVHLSVERHRRRRMRRRRMRFNARQRSRRNGGGQQQEGENGGDGGNAEEEEPKQRGFLDLGGLDHFCLLRLDSYLTHL